MKGATKQIENLIESVTKKSSEIMEKQVGPYIDRRIDELMKEKLKEECFKPLITAEVKNEPDKTII